LKYKGKSTGLSERSGKKGRKRRTFFRNIAKKGKGRRATKKGKRGREMLRAPEKGGGGNRFSR